MTRHIQEALALSALLLLCICLPGWAEAERPAPILPPDKPRPVMAEAEKRVELVSVGTFTVYAYCPCPKCCGQWSGGPTASGTIPTVGRTVAADWSVLPVGTEIYIDGLGWRTVEDTGSGITGNKLDVFMESHEAALEFGVKELEVWGYGR